MCKENIVAVYVDACCAQLSFPYGGMNYFFADCAVGLHIKSLGEIEGYMADYLFSEYWAKAYMDKDLYKVPGDTQAIMPMVLSDGFILQCDKPAIPTADCLIVDVQCSSTAFKVWNTVKDRGIVAAFNLDEKENPVKGQVSLADVPALEGEEYVVFEHFSHDAAIIDKTKAVNFLLKNHDDFRLWLFVPIIDGFALMGLVDNNLYYVNCAKTGKKVFLEIL